VIPGRNPALGLNQVANWHSLALALTCVALLSFKLSAVNNIVIPAWPRENGSADENQIDAELQKVAEEALGQRSGAIIVMDPQSGRIRAVVNSQMAFATPLMPGSTMKPFTALAALRSGLIDEDSRTVCPGRFTGLSFSVACVHEDHLPPFTPSQAITYSCNYYFAALGQRLRRDQLIETARQFGFGLPTGAAEQEVAGVLRPCEMGNSARVRIAETDRVSNQGDCNAREAIGESDHIQVTPIQLLTAYAALVNGGHLFEPHVSSAGDFRPVERANLNIALKHRAIISAGMAGAVRSGTARSARLDSLPLTVLGKTGTALPATGFRTNGWFVGFAGPLQNNRDIDPSKIELAVLVLLSRAHGSEAAVLAKPIFETYANEISRRDRKAQSPNKSTKTAEPDSNTISVSPRLPLSVSPVRVHLVHDNVTEELPLEDYVLGVMRAEGTTETEPEALKALAIAIRTFALKNRGRHAQDGYDFCSTTHCQRFVVRDPTVREGAGTLTDARVSDAARATEGQVLRDERGELVDSYFSASCGGETANIATLWGVRPPAYLRGVRDEYCESGPHATWTDVIALVDLLRALQSDSRTNVGSKLDQIIISKRDETGRAEFITLEGERRKVVRGWDFKIIIGRALGWNSLKSSRFEVSRAGSNFVFRGRGFGHGLGLCQEGAHVMAARGASYQKILQKYFPGTSAKRDGETRRSGDAESANTNSEWKEDLLLKETNFRVAESPRLRVMASGYVSAPDQRFATISSEHFRVTYPADAERRDIQQSLNILENARADYLHRASAASISLSNLPFLEIRVNASTGDFTGRTGQPWWAAAATKGNRIEVQPVAILKRRGVLTTTLRHELAHVVIDTVSRNQAPRWLEEGFAIYLAGEGRLFSHYVTRGPLSNDELEKRLGRPTSQQEMRALYAQAYRAVAEAVRQEGESGVWKKLAAA